MQDSRRKDIDVLRAFAVLPVIIFHFNQSLFPLGYLGVDIFFVISGYLITQLILKDFSKNSFSFTNFYTRRIKRILPNFLLVITFTLFFALIIFLISDVRALAKSVLSSLFFIPNFFFWITGGYFGQNDELKPLLHLWSLGIEGQFYLFCPILLYFFYKIKLSINKISLFIILITLISFFLNVFLIHKGHRNSLFFLFPFRVWEFGLGMLAALIEKEKIKYIYFEKVRTLIGLSLIGTNYVFKFSFIPESFLMCIGTAILLFRQNSKNYFFNKIFNLNILIFIGLISYSLYLWHWPIASFLKYISIDSLNSFHILFGVSLTFLLSIFSWKYIERPFVKNKIKNKYFFKGTGIFYAILITTSFIILYNKSIPSKYNNYLNSFATELGSTYKCSFLNYKFYGDSFGCLINDKTEKEYSTAIYGNSHAAMYGWAIKKKIVKNNSQVLLIHLNDCLPLIDRNISAECLRKAKNHFQAIIKDNKIKKVVVGLTWYSDIKIDEKNNLLKDNNYKLRDDSLIHLIEKLIENKKEVYLIGPIETPNFDPHTEARKLAFNKIEKISLFVEREKFKNKYFKSIDLFSLKMGDKFLRPDKILCVDKSCYFGDSESFFFSDQTHLSKSGSIKMFNLFDKVNFN
ncbi:acyltransferase [Pelagibacteraceae bacterium]|nr:acyltransferase [Pelagibacteraceae bacterium]